MRDIEVRGITTKEFDYISRTVSHIGGTDDIIEDRTGGDYSPFGDIRL